MELDKLVIKPLPVTGADGQQIQLPGFFDSIFTAAEDQDEPAMEEAAAGEG